MEFAFTGTHTAAEWGTWNGSNFEIRDDAIALAREDTPTYVSPLRVIADPPAAFTPVDLDVDECGDLYVLTAEGDIYHYDHEKARLRRLPCLWYPEHETGDESEEEPIEPVAICVTPDTIYVADGAVAGVVAFSKHSYQTRWSATEPFVDPIALVSDGRTAYALDGGPDDEDGFVVTMAVTGVVDEATVTGLESPVDLAMGSDESLYVLDWQVRDEGNGDGADPVPLVRRFSSAVPGERRFTTGDPVNGEPTVGAPGDGEFTEVAGDEVWIPPEYDPRCIEADTDRRMLVGVGSETVGETTLHRFLPSTESTARGRFERIPSFKETCSTLLLDRRKTNDSSRRLYAITGTEDVDGADGRPEIYVLEEARRYRFDPATDGYVAGAWRRFGSGTRGTEWHRVTMSLHLDDPGTQVRLRYHATDTVDVGHLEDDFGLTRAQADRLREVSVTGAWRLVELTPEELARLVSIPREWATEWIDQSWELVNETVDQDIDTIVGIGPTFSSRLRDEGVDSVVDLIGVDPESVATAADLPEGDLENWIAQAREIVDETVTDDWAEAVGIEPMAVAQLQDAGIGRISALLGHTPAELGDRLRVSTDQTEQWVERARQRIEWEWSRRSTVASLSNPRDALLEAADGQYLWVRIELLGSESSSPGVASFRAYFPRQSYLRHLPGIYREDAESAAFLERFLSVFESTFVDVEADIGSVTKYFDTWGIPADSLPWLGRWLAIVTDEIWPESVQRTIIDRAPELFKMRGTREGLLELLVIYLGETAVRPPDWEAALERERERIRALVASGLLTAAEATDEVEQLTQSAYVLEYADLDCVDVDGARKPYEAQIGCPQCFAVLVPPFATDEQMGAVDRIVESVTPAHAVGRAVGLRPWMQLGGESHPGNTYLGINSALADRDFVLEESTLGIDSALGKREEFSQLELSSRLGTDTVIS